MSESKRLLLLAGAIALAAVAANVVAFAGGSPACGATERASAPSPDGRWRAVAYDYGCGVLSEDYHAVALVPADAELPARLGDVFAGALPRPRVLGQAEAPPRRPEVHWAADGTLRVRYDARLDVVTLARVARGIAVDARPFE